MFTVISAATPKSEIQVISSRILKVTPENKKKVDALVKQAQGFAEALPKVAEAAYDAAEKFVTVKTEAVLADRKAKAANQAASLV